MKISGFQWQHVKVSVRLYQDINRKISRYWGAENLLWHQWEIIKLSTLFRINPLRTYVSQHINVEENTSDKDVTSHVSKQKWRKECWRNYYNPRFWSLLFLGQKLLGRVLQFSSDRRADKFKPFPPCLSKPNFLITQICNRFAIEFMIYHYSNIGVKDVQGNSGNDFNHSEN